jgi:hypothetical protein
MGKSLIPNSDGSIYVGKTLGARDSSLREDFQGTFCPCLRFSSKRTEEIAVYDGTFSIRRGIEVFLHRLNDNRGRAALGPGVARGSDAALSAGCNAIEVEEPAAV